MDLVKMNDTQNHAFVKKAYVSMQDLLDTSGVTKRTYQTRVNKGWTPAEAIFTPSFPGKRNRDRRNYPL